MSIKFQQACYGKPQENWELLNLSSDISAPTAKTFEKIGTGCMPYGIESKLLMDLSLSETLYALTPIESGTLLLRTQYGGFDGFGRPKLFAHGYIFPEETALQNPNDILAVSDCNFHFSKEETEIIPEKLAMDSPLTLEQAIRETGLNIKGIKVLLGCVFSLLDGTYSKPLYIVCNDGTQCIKPVIFTILSLLPCSIRRQLLFSNSDFLRNISPYTILFTSQAIENELCFNLSDGTATTDFKDIRQNPEHYSFFITLCRILEQGDLSALTEYINRIQSSLYQMNDDLSSPLQLLDVAYTFCQRIQTIHTESEEKITKLLLTTLIDAPLRCAYADDKIARILEVYFNKGLTPNETLLHRLEQRCKLTASEEYRAQYNLVRYNYLTNKGQNAACEYLTSLYCSSTDAALEWIRILCQRRPGQSIAVSFFQTYIEKSNDLEALRALYKQIKSACSEEGCRKLCYCILVQSTQITLNHLRMTSLADAAFKDHIESYRSFYGELSPLPENAPDFWLEIKKKYWEYYGFKDFIFSQTVFSNAELIALDQNTKYGLISHFKSLFILIEREKASDTVSESSILNMLSHFQMNHDSPLLCGKIQSYIVKSLKTRKDLSWDFWKSVSKLTERSYPGILQKMIAWELPLWYDTNLFSNHLATDFSLQNDRQQILDSLRSSDMTKFVSENPAWQKSAKAIESLIRDGLKEESAKQKQFEKEQRKAEETRIKEAELAQKRERKAAEKASKEDEDVFRKPKTIDRNTNSKVSDDKLAKKAVERSKGNFLSKILSKFNQDEEDD